MSEVTEEVKPKKKKPSKKFYREQRLAEKKTVVKIPPQLIKHLIYPVKGESVFIARIIKPNHEVVWEQRYSPNTLEKDMWSELERQFQFIKTIYS